MAISWKRHSYIKGKKTLIKKIEAKILNGIKNDPNFEKNSIGKILKQFDFKVKNVAGVSGKIWINNKAKLVVKVPYLTCNIKKKVTPRFAIPTYIFQARFRLYPQDNLVLHSIFIQPLGKAGDAGLDAYDILYGKKMKIKGALNKKKHFGNDMHEGNAVMYNNEAVLIDW